MMRELENEAVLLQQAKKLETILPDVMHLMMRHAKGQPLAELPGQVRVCRILEAGPVTLSALGEELGVTPSAVTQIADRLERAGYVTRAMGDSDRRVRRLCLTPDGEEMMRSRHQARTERAAKVLDVLPPLQRDALIESLEALASAARSLDISEAHHGEELWTQEQ
jgi:DNA-binding MarR family transcriptional regulator